MTNKNKKLYLSKNTFKQLMGRRDYFAHCLKAHGDRENHGCRNCENVSHLASTVRKKKRGEGINGGVLLFSLLFSFIQCRTFEQGKMPLTFRMGLMSSVKYFWKHPHNYTQMSISMEILNQFKLTMKINHG